MDFDIVVTVSAAHLQAGEEARGAIQSAINQAVWRHELPSSIVVRSVTLLVGQERQ
jgi:hypothetical protein